MLEEEGKKKKTKDDCGKTAKGAAKLLFSKLKLINNLCQILLFHILFHAILLTLRCLVFVAASVHVAVFVSLLLCI